MSAEIIPYYVEINVVTLIILTIIYINVRGTTVYFTNEILFRQTILCTMVAIIADATATALEGVMYPGAVAVNYVLDIIYFIVSLAIPFLLMAYVRSIVDPAAKIFDLKSQITAIPLYIYAALTIASVKTGWVFSISPENIYTRGPLRFLHGVIAALVLVRVAIYTIYFTKKGKITGILAKYLKFIPLFPLVGVVARNLIQGSNLIWSATAIGLLIIFVYSQNSRSIIDALTGLNNRGRARDYLRMKIEGLANDQELFYTIIDLNYFKQINDTYGHLEGDKALKQVADILIKSMTINRDFLARYGGDEFVMISVRPKAGNVDFEIKRILETVDSVNALGENPYKLSISYGTASLTKENMLTAEELLIAADRNMYDMKEKFHEKEDSILREEKE